MAVTTEKQLKQRGKKTRLLFQAGGHCLGRIDTLKQIEHAEHGA